MSLKFMCNKKFTKQIQLIYDERTKRINLKEVMEYLMRQSSVVPDKIVDEHCAICKSPARDYVDQMISENVAEAEILNYLKARGVNRYKMWFGIHRSKHWTAVSVKPKSLQEAKQMNPNVLSHSEATTQQQLANKEYIQQQFDKIDNILGIIQKQDKLIKWAMKRAKCEDAPPNAIRVAKEVLESKLKSIVILAKFDGDVGPETNINVLNIVQNIIPQLSSFVKELPLTDRKNLLHTLEQRRHARVVHFEQDQRPSIVRPVEADNDVE